MHSTVQLDWFNHNSINDNTLHEIPNTPDIVFINETDKSVIIIEVGCSFDLYMDICFTTKIMKYQPLVECVRSLGYTCQLFVLVFGSQGHVQKLVLHALQLGGLHKSVAKRLAKYCSVSATISSCFIFP